MLRTLTADHSKPHTAAHSRRSPRPIRDDTMLEHFDNSRFHLHLATNQPAPPRIHSSSHHISLTQFSLRLCHALRLIAKARQTPGLSPTSKMNASAAPALQCIDSCTLRNPHHNLRSHPFLRHYEHAATAFHSPAQTRNLLKSSPGIKGPQLVPRLARQHATTSQHPLVLTNRIPQDFIPPTPTSSSRRVPPLYRTLF